MRILDRLATYKEKILAIKGKIKSALFYPISVIVVAIVVVWVIMIFVIPAFKKVFSSFGADLPAADADRDGDVRFRRQLVVARCSCSSSERVIAFFYAAPALGGVPLRTRPHLAQDSRSSAPILEKATIARWTRTLQTMFAAGVPLVESLDAVGGASGNAVYAAGDQADPDRGQHRHEPHQRDDQHQALPDRWCCR